MPASPSTEKETALLGAAPNRCTQDASLKQFLECLFDLLDCRRVRYCVLHSHKNLPRMLQGDLDLAVHPEDWLLLPRVVRGLKAEGYQPLQCLEYAVNGHYLVFGRPIGPNLFTAAVDFISEHRRSGVILGSGETLVKGRRRSGCFWIPDPAVEFSYLLAKKILKRSIKTSQALRLRELCDQIGRENSESEAAKLFGRRVAPKVVDACLEGRLAQRIPALRRRLWLNSLLKHPGMLLQYWPAECARVLRRWRCPTGFFLGVLGPDGAGKSTLIQSLSEQIGGAFRRRRIIHWRPMLFRRRDPGGAVTDPHGQPLRSSVASVVRLLWWCLDYCCGYWLVIRPWKACSGLVIFDRYYHDLVADPKRFRYGGPVWLAKALGRLVPSPDLVLLLDAPASAVRSRKRELPGAEIERQRSAYLWLADQCRSSVILDATADAADVSAEAGRTLLRHLAQRFEKCHSWWLCALDEHHKTRNRPSGYGSRRENLDLALRSLASSNPDPAFAFPKTTNDAGDLCRSFIVLPSRAAPRWLLPLDSKRSTLAALSLYSPCRTRGGIAKSLLYLAAKAGLACRLGEVIMIPERARQSLQALVVESLGAERAVFSLSIGASERYPKLTAQAATPDGEVLGYIKIPLTAEAAVRVRREARTLRQLHEFGGLCGSIPGILYAGDWNGRYVLFQSPVEGGRGPVSLGAAHRDFLHWLAAAYRSPKPGPQVTDAVALRLARLGREADLAWLCFAERALAWAGSRLGGKVVPCGISHGDFAPWNTRITRGSLRVFDWEAAAWGVPLCWDGFHFGVQVQSLLGKSGSLAPNRLGATDKALLALYLIRSLCEGHSEGMNERGMQFRKELLLELSAAAQPLVSPCARGRALLPDSTRSEVPCADRAT